MDFLEVIFGDERYLFILRGLRFTLITAIVSSLIGFVLGVVIAILRLSNDFLEESKYSFLKKYNILNWFATLYVDIIRGTPVIVQLMIINNIIFVGNLRYTPKIIIASIAFGINSSAYISEIIRSGIQNLDKGQMEAARALGMPYKTSMLLIILPQALKTTLPTLVNEFIVILKETSVVGFIGGEDLLRSASSITSRTANGTYPLLAVAFIYFVLTTIFTYFMRGVERRTKTFD